MSKGEAGKRRSRRKPQSERPLAAPYEARPHLPDYLGSGLKLIFVGFNPGDLSSRLGHYYAWPGNQFWRLLQESGLTPVRLQPESDHRLLEFGIGITDVVKRWSKSSSDLRIADYETGVPALLEKIRKHAPSMVAFNGKLAYEKVVGRRADLGLQSHRIEGTPVFVLPSSSGRNGSLTWNGKLAWYRRLRLCLEAAADGRSASDTRSPLGSPSERRPVDVR